MSQPDEVTASSTGKSFPPHPAEQVVIRCVDCVGLGEKVEQYQGKGPRRLTGKVALVFQSPLARDDGEHYQLSREFTLSVGEKANLRKFLTAWRGRSFTEDEARTFAVHSVVGATALVTVEHVTRNDRTYANIASITRVPNGMPVPDTGSYVRSEYWAKKKAEYKAEADRFRTEQLTGAGEHEEPEATTNDDMPF